MDRSVSKDALDDADGEEDPVVADDDKDCVVSKICGGVVVATAEG
jgi:hypothetical protein